MKGLLNESFSLCGRAGFEARYSVTGAAHSASLGSCSILTCAGMAALKADALQFL